MYKRMLAYLKYIDGILDHSIPVTSAFSSDGDHEITMQRDTFPTRKDYERILAHHLDQIAFFQHERTIHLLVTLFIALLTIGSLFCCLFAFHYALLALFTLSLILLVPYIQHYYRLENGVQKMYTQYDQLVKQIL